jgi:hypothetical protein
VVAGDAPTPSVELPATSQDPRRSGAGNRTISCSSWETSRACSEPSTRPSRPLPTRAGPHRDRLPHGRIIKRSSWVTDAAGMDFPHVTRAVRIRRDGYDAVGTLISKEIVHAVTSLGEDRAGPADLAKLARGQWGIESVHWVRHRIPGRFQSLATAEAGSRSWPPAGTSRSACSYIAGVNCDQPHSPGHRTRPDPHAQLPTAMRHRSQRLGRSRGVGRARSRKLV